MTRRAELKSKWPGPVDPGRLDPEERVEIMFEMSSAMGEIVLDSIKDEHPGISESALLSLARKRIEQRRRLHRRGVDSTSWKSSTTKQLARRKRACA